VPATEAPLTWRHDIRDGLPTLTVGGTLTLASSELLHDATIGLLRRHRAEVLIDLAALTAADDKAVLVFAKIVAEALQWPEVLVLVCAATGEVMRLLGADVLDPRLVFDSVAAGRSAAARHGRDVITDACLRWNEPDLVGPAALVASELVTNAAVHAHTMMTLQVRLRPCHLRIAVFDGSTLPAVASPAAPASNRGRGLHLVDAVSAAWGWTPRPGGKVVWAALARQAR
jgi:hypothetical protein